MGYWNDKMIDGYQWNITMGNLEESNPQSQILDSKYVKPDLNGMINSQSCLLQEQRWNPNDTLSNHREVIHINLIKWNDQPVKINLETEATTFHGKLYRIPHVHVSKGKKDTYLL